MLFHVLVHGICISRLGSHCEERHGRAFRGWDTEICIIIGRSANPELGLAKLRWRKGERYRGAERQEREKGARELGASFPLLVNGFGTGSELPGALMAGPTSADSVGSDRAGAGHSLRGTASSCMNHQPRVAATATTSNAALRPTSPSSTYSATYNKLHVTAATP